MNIKQSDASTPNAMTLDEFQRGCIGTKKYPKDHDAAVTYTLLALAGEAGEAANEWKKVLRGDYQLDPAKRTIVENKIMDELGDVLYYVAAASFELGYTLSQVARHNQLKLTERTGIDVVAFALS